MVMTLLYYISLSALFWAVFHINHDAVVFPLHQSFGLGVYDPSYRFHLMAPNNYTGVGVVIVMFIHGFYKLLWTSLIFIKPFVVRFMGPLTSGDYPQSMRSLVGKRLPKFSKEQAILIKDSFDFLGLNYYTANYAANEPHLSNERPNYLTDSLANLTSVRRDGTPIGPRAASDWLYVYPRGIQELLLYIKRKYNNPLIYITENGIDEFNDQTLSLEEVLLDTFRIDYHYRHLFYLQSAIRNGVNVKGYFAWSLLDNFEWASGHTVRFGINFVDYKNGLKRHQKLSARWFENFLKRS